MRSLRPTDILLTKGILWEARVHVEGGDPGEDNNMEHIYPVSENQGHLSLEHFVQGSPPSTSVLCAKSLQLCLFSTLWTTVLWTTDPMDPRAHQASLSMVFLRQEYWSGMPCLPSGDLLNPGMEFMSLTSVALAGGFFITSVTWEFPVHSLNMWLLWMTTFSAHCSQTAPCALQVLVFSWLLFINADANHLMSMNIFICSLPLLPVFMHLRSDSPTAQLLVMSNSEQIGDTGKMQQKERLYYFLYSPWSWQLKHFLIFIFYWSTVDV